MAESLLNYDPEDMQQSPHILSSPKQTTIPPSLPNPPPQSRHKRPKRHRQPTSPHIHPQSPPSRTLTLTPPLAMPAEPSSSPISQTNQIRPPSPEIISFTERNLVIMEIQEQVDWTVVAANSGVEIDRVMKWWMRASSDIVRRG